MYVNTNVSALHNQRYLNNINTKLNTTYQRLASGLRINSAKDDAAGLQIADRLTAQINGLNQGNRNASDGIALAQTAEAGMDEITGMLQRIRSLAVQANNGTNTSKDREALSKEASSLANEISRIAKQTTYGGKTILNGIQDGNSLVSKAGNANNGTAQKVSLQVGANMGDTIDYELANMQFSVVGKAANAQFDTNVKGKFLDVTAGEITFKFSVASGAKLTIDLMDKMIEQVDASRSNLGAIQNRLESSIRNQSNVATNTADARSRIQDADFALESANLAQQSVIQQAANAMLMQANARPQLALRAIA